MVAFLMTINLSISEVDHGNNTRCGQKSVCLVLAIWNNNDFPASKLSTFNEK